MDVGKEISHNIRSAIKAKLVELGAYVDDELPDYIMVMVANKRSAEQMADDLSLFLGASNTKFTTWLSGLLTKLEKIGEEPAQAKEQTEQRASEQRPSEQRPSEQKPSEQRANERRSSNDDRKQRHHETQQKSRAGASHNASSSNNRTASKTTVQEPVIEDSIKLTTDNADEFDDDVKPTSVKTDRLSTKVMTSDSQLASSSRPRNSTSKPASGNQDKPEASKSTYTSSDRKRRLGSAVGAVLHHDVEEEEEEQYDPRRPAIGSVASVVHISQRKSSVPPALQANKSLLMKAMSAAESSVEPAAKKLAVEKVRPMVHESRSHTDKSSAGRPSIKGRLGRRPGRPEEMRNIQIVREGPEKRAESGGQEVLDEGDILDLSFPDDLDIIQADSPEVRRPEGDTLYQSGAEESDFTDDGGGHQDTRTCEVKALREPSPKFVVTLDHVDPSLMGRESSDGGSFEAGSELSGALDETVEAGDSELMRNIVRVKPVVVSEGRSRGSVEEEVTFSFNSDDEDVEMVLDKKSTLPDKCRFFPNCRNKESCPFYHPTEPCQKFPKCRFGQKCLYIHPPCRFDGGCTRPSCPFTHSSAKPRLPHSIVPPTVIVQPIKVPVFPTSAAPPAPRALHPSKITCKFFPNCTNMECPFDHPKPCRYGISCSFKATCKYLHPELPSRQKLKWNSQNKTNMVSPTPSDPLSSTYSFPSE